jgi:hypothetical protein
LLKELNFWPINRFFQFSFSSIIISFKKI